MMVTTIDYNQARRNMVDSQIATMGVIDPVLLDILRTVPRERFVPQGKQDLAYIDEDLPLGGGAFLMEPLIFARMVQSAAPHHADTVLSVGDATGYPAAVLSKMAGAVVALESQAGAMDAARRVWDDMGCHNIEVARGTAERGCPEEGPYSLILVNGSMAEIPLDLIAQLKEGGRLVGVLRKAGQTDGKGILATKLPNGQHSSKVLFDALTPYVPDMAARPGFSFRT